MSYDVSSCFHTYDRLMDESVVFLEVTLTIWTCPML